MGRPRIYFTEDDKVLQKKAKAEYLKQYHLQHKMTDKPVGRPRKETQEEPQQEKNPVGRPRKYFTEEEKLKARQEKQNDYYWKNRDKILQKKRTSSVEPDGVDEFLRYADDYIRSIPQLSRGELSDNDIQKELTTFYNQTLTKWCGLDFTLKEFLEAYQVINKALETFSNYYNFIKKQKKDRRLIRYVAHLPQALSSPNIFIERLNKMFSY